MADVSIGTLTGTISITDEGSPKLATFGSNLGDLDTKFQALGSKTAVLDSSLATIGTSASAAGSTITSGAMPAVTALGTAATTTAGQLGGVSAAITATGSVLAATTAPAKTLTERLDAVQASADRVRAVLAGLGPPSTSVGAAFTEGARTSGTLSERLDAVQASADRVKTTLAGLGPGGSAAGAGLSAAGAGAGAVGQGAAGAAGSVQSLNQSLAGAVLSGFAFQQVMSKIEGLVGSIVSFGKESALTAARTDVLVNAAGLLGQRAGLTAQGVTELIGSIKAQGITTQESANLVAQLSRANLDLSQASKLAAVAQDAAALSGMNSSEVLQHIIQGIITLQPRMLRTVGLMVNLGQEEKNWAAEMGRTAQSLTAEEKQIIALNAVLAEGDKLHGLYGSSMQFVGKQITSLPRLFQEAENAIGGQFQGALSVAVSTLSGFLKFVAAAPALVTELGAAVVVLGTTFTTAIVGAKVVASLGGISSMTEIVTGGLIGQAGLVAAFGLAGAAIGQFILKQEAASAAALSAAETDASVAAARVTYAKQAGEAIALQAAEEAAAVANAKLTEANSHGLVRQFIDLEISAIQAVTEKYATAIAGTATLAEQETAMAKATDIAGTSIWSYHDALLIIQNDLNQLYPAQKKMQELWANMQPAAFKVPTMKDAEANWNATQTSMEKVTAETDRATTALRAYRAAIDPIAPALTIAVENMKLTHESTKELADRFGITVGQLSQFEAALKSTEKSQNKFNTALATLEGQLSGSALLTKANEYAIVLAKIGGASTLTSAETDTVVKAYTAVIEKYSLLGPAGEATVTKFQALLAPLTGRVQSLSESLTKARAELAGMSEAKLDELTTAIQSGAFTMKQLEAATGLSEGAIKLFKQQIDEAGKGMKETNTIFTDYNKKVVELSTALDLAAQSGAPVEAIKARYGSMIKAVVEETTIFGDSVGALPKRISDAFLAITIEAGANNMLKQLAKFGEAMNTQVKADMLRVDKAIIDTLGVQIKALDAADDATAKYYIQSLGNEIKNKEAIGGVTKQTLDLRRQMYVAEYQQELDIIDRDVDKKKGALDKTLSDTKEFWDAMAALDNEANARKEVAAGKYNQQLEQMETKSRVWSTQAIKAMEDVATAFGSLASSTGSASGDIIFDLAAITQAMVGAMKAGDEFAKGNYISGAAQGFTAVNQATNSPNTGTNVGGGALAGAAIGANPALLAATGGWSVVIGAAAGAIYGWFKSRQNTEFMKEVGRDWAVTITKEMADQIKKDSENLFGGNRQAAEIFDISKIMQAAGGLNSTNFDQFTSKLRDVFSMYQTGAFTASQAVKVLDDNWQAFADAGTDADGRLSAGLKEVIQLTVTSGLKTKEIADYMKGQGAAAITGFNAVVLGSGLATKTQLEAIAQKMRDALAAIEKTGDSIGKKGPTELQRDALASSDAALQKLGQDYKALTAEAAGQSQLLSDLGVQAVASISAAVAAGMSWPDALKAAAPGLQTLVDGYNALGIGIDNAALRSILFQSSMMEANPQLIAGVAGLGQEMIALDNLGLMNTDTFGAMERTGAAMYTRLQAAAASMGGGTRDALAPMQDFLHKAADEAKLLGIPLDDNTQMLIDQSKDLGIWQKTGKEATADLTAGMQSLVDKVGELIDRLKSIPDVSFNINGRYNPPTLPATPDVPGFATGTRGRLIDFGPRGTLVTLHNKERVQTAPEAAAADKAKVFDIVPILAGQQRQLAEQQRMNDFLLNRFDKSLARAVRDESQKAARR